MFNCIDSCFVESVDSLQDEYFYKSEIFSQLKRMGPLGPLPCKAMGHILYSWDNDPGSP